MSNQSYSYSKRTNIIISEIAIMSALAIIFDIIANYLEIAIFPYGGSISISMLPIFIIAYRRGLGAGLLTGVLVGYIQTLFGSDFLTIIQFILDYPVPYMLVGAAGAFASLVRKDSKRSILWISVGTFFGSLLRYASHVASGVVFWGEYAPKEFNEWTWSIYYNMTYMLPSFVICLVILLIINNKARFLLTNK